MRTSSFTDLTAPLFPEQLDAVSAPQIQQNLVAPTETRNEVIDVVRLFAAAGIVFVHAGESPAFERWGNCFRFGVPFFLFASLFYQSSSLRRNPQRTLTEFIGSRIKRLYLPFLVWSAIYLTVRNFNRIFVLHLSPVMPHPAMLWTGTEYHLWFLPFLLMCSILLGVMQRTLFQQDPRLRWPAIGIAIGIGLAIASAPMPAMPSVTESTFDNPTFAYLQWWLALPAAAWAFAFAWLTTQGNAINSVPQLIGIAGILLVMWCSIQQTIHGIELAPRGLSGLGCMAAALSPWNGRAVTMLARKGRMGYGIYLCHVIPVEILHIVSHRLHIPPSASLDILTFEISFVAAFAIVALLSKSQRLAWLIG